MSIQRRRLVVGIGLAVVLLALVPGLLQWWLGSAADRQLVYAIPAGTAARLAAGEEVSVLPSTIRLTIGERDTLIIRNDDRETVTIGPFRIEPGQQFRQQFNTPGTYDLTCSVHRGERLQLVVE